MNILPFKPIFIGEKFPEIRRWGRVSFPGVGPLVEGVLLTEGKKEVCPSLPQREGKTEILPLKGTPEIFLSEQTLCKSPHVTK